MPKKTFKARVKLGSGQQEVTVEADSPVKAREMLEAQYGKGSLTGTPVEVKK